ncbi:unnamed protein product [Cylicocyclus nassatus]|uniref:Phlebovirus glycoprotein G2 fusion domain-containing protein n=1 Tax=Cylicocyclus nassatus TaxID=53992 RepID=A0AA36H7G1_CYLNA|nr:unnamed protein product [Cylicocyclus nassatus]
MEAVLYKRPIAISVHTLTTLTANFKVYAEPIAFSQDEQSQLDEAQAAIDLISGGINQLNKAKEDLKSLLNQFKEYYSTSTKDEKKNLNNAIEEIERETNFNEVLGKATEMVFMLESRMTEAKSAKNRLMRKISLDNRPDMFKSMEADEIQRKNSQEQVIDDTPMITSQGSEWLSEDSSASATVTRIEAVINTRPLAKLPSTDISDIPLRPVDFLQGNLAYSIPNVGLSTERDNSYDPDLIQTALQARQALEYSETVANKFWERWNTEYLTMLREIQQSELRQSRHTALRDPIVGEIVLIQQDFIPRGNWSYGKIIELLRSQDGQVRSVKLQLPNRHILHRPLTKIYPLELRSTPINDNPIEEIQDNAPETATRPLRQARVRALQAIQEFEESLEEPNTPRASQYISLGTYPLLLTLFLTIISAANATQSALHCLNGTVNITSPKEQFELCIAERCKTYAKNSSNLSLRLPHTSQANNISISMKFKSSTNMVHIARTCKMPSICDHPHLILSKKLLANPHCWPTGAIISIAALIYLVLTIPLILYLCCAKRKKEQVRYRPHNRLSLRTFAPAPIHNTNIIALSLIALTTLASACQHGHMRHNVDLECGRDNQCTYELNREVLFNKIQVNLCVQIRHANKTIGTLHIKNNPITMECSKRTLFFTRDSKPRVYSAVRCHQAGSCTEQICANLKANGTVQELERQHAEEYPGYSGCERACGGLACGCFFPIPACSFYRVAHVPRNEDVYEVLDCLEWKPSVNLSLQLTLFNRVASKQMILLPYVTQKFEEIEFTAISVHKPALPVLHRRFAISNNTALAIPEGYKLPVECSSAANALSDFRSCANRMICACRGTNPPTRCDCPNENIQDIKADASNKLPTITPFSQTFVYDNSIVTRTQEAEVTIKIESKLLLDSGHYTLDQECQVSVTNVTGCYDCQEGATISISCLTEIDAWLTIRCGAHTFPVECGAKTTQSKVVLDYDRAIVEERCTATCKGKQIEFDLAGHLEYMPKHLEAPSFETDGDFTWHQKLDWFSDIKIPDLKPLMKLVAQHWKLTLAAAPVPTRNTSIPTKHHYAGRSRRGDAHRAARKRCQDHGAEDGLPATVIRATPGSHGPETGDPSKIIRSGDRHASGPVKTALQLRILPLRGQPRRSPHGKMPKIPRRSGKSGAGQRFGPLQQVPTTTPWPGLWSEVLHLHRGPQHAPVPVPWHIQRVQAQKELKF